jgi:hypothetical protein
MVILGMALRHPHRRSGRSYMASRFACNGDSPSSAATRCASGSSPVSNGGSEPVGTLSSHCDSSRAGCGEASWPATYDQGDIASRASRLIEAKVRSDPNRRPALPALGGIRRTEPSARQDPMELVRQSRSRTSRSRRSGAPWTSVRPRRSGELQACERGSGSRAFQGAATA